AVGPGAIGQEGDGKLAVGVDPQRGSCVTQMAERSRPEILSGLRRRRWRVPTQSATCAFGCGLAPRKESNGLGSENGRSTLEHGVSEFSHVFGGGKEAGVSGDATEDKCVLVLDFALDESPPQVAVFARGGVRPSFVFDV